MSNEFFPQRPAANPTIYAYEDTNPQYKGLLKVGDTNSLFLNVMNEII